MHEIGDCKTLVTLCPYYIGLLKNLRPVITQDMAVYKKVKPKVFGGHKNLARTITFGNRGFMLQSCIASAGVIGTKFTQNVNSSELTTLWPSPFELITIKKGQWEVGGFRDS